MSLMNFISFQCFRVKRYVMFVFLFLLVVVNDVGAQQVVEDTLIIGTKETVPFVIKNPDGSWRGISIDLWEKIALDLGYTNYKIIDLENLEGLTEATADSSIDVAVAALSITEEREKRFDFTHPFYITGFSIAVRPQQEQGWLQAIQGFFSVGFLKVIVFLSLVLFVFGLIVWFFEHKKNPEQFGGGFLRGIGSGFWWSAVTMTTVGYGDKAPETFGGRIVALIWMFAGLIIISSFTAAITTALTVSSLGHAVQGPDDLIKVVSGTVIGSTSENYLKEKRLLYRSYPTPFDGLKAVHNNEVETMVYDEPILRYLIRTEFEGGTLKVLPTTFQYQYYGFALPQHSPLRESINQALLEEIERPQWQETLYQYLGK